MISHPGRLIGVGAACRIVSNLLNLGSSADETFSRFPAFTGMAAGCAGMRIAAPLGFRVSKGDII